MKIFLSSLVFIYFLICAYRSESQSVLDPDFGFEGNYHDSYRLKGQIGIKTDESSAIAVTSDHKAFIGGYTENDCGSDFSLMKLQENGSPDLSFGLNGIVYLPLSQGDEKANAIILQTDGKILMGGSVKASAGSTFDYAIARITSDGKLDNSFNTSGYVFLDFNGTQDELYDIKISGNKILAAGSSIIGTDTSISIARFNMDGSLDMTFNGTGKKIVALGGDEIAYSMAIQSNGKIVLAGRTHNGSNEDMVVVRLDADGAIDNSFDTDGVFKLGFYNFIDYVQTVKIQTDGKIVLFGQTSNKPGTFQLDFEYAFVRLNEDGSLDASFDTDGKVTAGLGNNPVAYTMDIASDGSITGAGRTFTGSNYELYSIRVNSLGALESSFGTNGKSILSFDNNFNNPTGMQIDNQGRIWMSVSSDVGLGSTRLLPSGQYDLSFDADGRMNSPVGTFSDGLNVIRYTTDHKILFGGMLQENPFIPALLRLNIDGSRDLTFGTNGAVRWPFSDYGLILNMLPLPDKKTLLMGSIRVAKLTESGEADLSFNSTGMVDFIIHNDFNNAKDAAVYPDGKIIVGGITVNGSDNDYGIMRLHANGTLDNSFDSDGKAFYNFSTGEQFSCLKLLPNSKILVAGIQLNSGYEIVLLRLNDNGSLDNSFGTNGKLTFKVGGASVVSDIALQSDGKILLSGSSASNGDNYFTVFRVLAEGGGLDNTFGASGAFTIPTLMNSTANTVSTDNTKIVAAGYFATNDQMSAVVVQLTMTGTPDPGFNGGSHYVHHQFSNDFYSAGAADISSDGKAIVGGTAHCRIIATQFNSDLQINTSLFSSSKGKQLNISCLPNPAKDQVYMLAEKNYSRGALSIITMHGKLARQWEEFELKEGKQSVDLSGLKEGMYLLVFETDEGRFVEKLILQE